MKKMIFSLLLLLLITTTGFSKSRLTQIPMGNKLTSVDKVMQIEKKSKQSNLPTYLIDSECGTWVVFSDSNLDVFQQLILANYINNNICHLPVVI